MDWGVVLAVGSLLKTSISPSWLMEFPVFTGKQLGGISSLHCLEMLSGVQAFLS